ncbi:hypothetical protein [Scleromatobacter humisilvae]|nr:hypothetical protein [Scleromatobacter humisilvae]
MKIWAYIEAHHEEYGVALFVLPVLLLTFVLGAAAYGLTLLLFG